MRQAPPSAVPHKHKLAHNEMQGREITATLFKSGSAGSEMQQSLLLLPPHVPQVDFSAKEQYVWQFDARWYKPQQASSLLCHMKRARETRGIKAQQASSLAVPGEKPGLQREALTNAHHVWIWGQIARAN